MAESANGDDVAHGIVVHLRAAAVVHRYAPDLRDLVVELTVRSTEFATRWQRNDVRSRTNAHKAYRHPVAGPMTLTYDAFDVARSDGQRLVVHQAPPGTPDHAALLRSSSWPATSGSGGSEGDLRTGQGGPEEPVGAAHGEAGVLAADVD